MTQRKHDRNPRQRRPRRIEPLENRRLLAADLLTLSPADDTIYARTGNDLVLTFTDQVVRGEGARGDQAGCRR